MLDSVLCIILPIMNNEMHFFPSFSDTCATISSAPYIFSSGIGLKFDVIRPLILVVFLSFLIAAISYKRRDPIIQYEITIFLLYVIYVATAVYSLPSMISSGGGSLSTQSLLSYVALDGAKILVFHIPFALLSLVIFIAMHKYREIIEEIKMLKEEKK